MQQASRGQPRTLVSPLPSPTLSHAESSFSVSRYASHGPVPSSLGNSSVAPPLQRLGGESSSTAGQSGRNDGRPSHSQPSAEARRKMEAVAQTHWSTFRVFLDTGGSQNHPRQNKAREKLTRLSSVQFQELSTDVYDEVLRRTRPSQSNQISLPPNPTFHPKRNQAREKLASLQISRFKDLASDVFFEIERRFPSVMTTSSGSHRSDGSGDRSPNHVSPARHDGAQPNALKSLDSRVASASNRQQNVFRQTAVIPMKSTMIEDDGETDQETDLRSPRFETDRSSLNSSGYGNNSMSDVNRSPRTSKESNNKPDSGKISELLTKITSLEAELKRQGESNAELVQLRRDMADVLNRNDKLEDENKAMKARINERVIDTSENTDLTRENNQLKKELAAQQEVTEEVRREAGGFLKEMRDLSERESAIYEQAETLQARVTNLESEVENWKDNFYKLKTQLRQVKATSQFFSPVPDFQDPHASSFVHPDGIIKDISVTKFQSSIDTLLRVARSKTSDLPECMKEIILVVRSIQKDIDTASASSTLDPRVPKLKQRMSSTTNNLMTACKNHANGGPLSPVSLVDAAASHLASTVIELVKICKLSTSSNDLDIISSPKLMRSDSARSVTSRPQLQHRTTQPDTYDRNYSPSPKSPQRHEFGDRRIGGQVNGSEHTRSNTEESETITDKLRLFLESQTEGIVAAIQRLLSAIRSDAKTPVLQTYMGDIVTIVSGVTTSMRDAFASSQALRASAGSIVTALESCTTRIREMEVTAARSTESQASKEFKQRLAGIAFDTAKQTKELSIILQASEEDEVDLT